MQEQTATATMLRIKTMPMDEQELHIGWAEIERMSRQGAAIKMGAKTDLGRVRENNEDKFDFFEPEDPQVLAEKGAFYAVADGMGGHSAGQIACELALKTIIKVYYEDTTSDMETSLRHAIDEANALIYDTAVAIPDRQGMGTTLTAAIVHNNQVTVAQVGDSRAYLIRDGQIMQLTEDHSWVAEQVKLGSMTLEEAQNSPFRNIITRSIGTAATIQADLTTYALQVSDTLVLCSDGLSGHLEPLEIMEITQAGSPSAAAMHLIEAANERGGRDNITALVLAVRWLAPDAPGMTAENKSTENKSTENKSTENKSTENKNEDENTVLATEANMGTESSPQKSQSKLMKRNWGRRK